MAYFKPRLSVYWSTVLFSLYIGPELEIDFQGRGRVEVEGRIFRVDESEIEGFDF